MLGLERKERKHVVDGRPQLGCPARPPSPNGRRDIVHDGNVRADFLHFARDPKIEIRAIHCDQGVRIEFQHFGGCLLHSGEQTRNPRQNFADAHDRNVADGENRFEAELAHQAAADPSETSSRLLAHQLGDQACSKRVA